MARVAVLPFLGTTRWRQLHIAISQNYLLTVFYVAISRSYLVDSLTISSACTDKAEVRISTAQLGAK